MKRKRLIDNFFLLVLFAPFILFGSEKVPLPGWMESKPLVSGSPRSLSFVWDEYNTPQQIYVDSFIVVTTTDLTLDIDNWDVAIDAPDTDISFDVSGGFVRWDLPAEYAPSFGDERRWFKLYGRLP